MDTISSWFKRRLNDPQVLTLLIVCTAGFFLIYFFGVALGPFFTAAIVAYLLEGTIGNLTRLKIPRLIAFTLVYSFFVFLILITFLVLLPALFQQLTRLLKEIPSMTAAFQVYVTKLSDYATGVVEPEMIENLLIKLGDVSQGFIASSVTATFQSIPGLVSLVIYLVLVPFLVFFFLKDKQKLIISLWRFLPDDRTLLVRVLRDVDRGMGGYIRGKFWEIVVVGVATYATFTFMGFDYAFLMGILNGLSVIIPYLGAAVVTVPVVVLALFQWGLTWDTGNLLIAYAIIQAIDGNVLVPIVFSEAVQTHPTTIIMAILIFGHLWGILGVFFAVPLAILFKSILDALPTTYSPAKT